MRQLMLASMALVVSIPAPARHGSAIPQFDAARICRDTSNLGFSEDQSFAQCMRDETQAKNQLAKDWASYSTEARSRYSAETTIGGSPSYVDLSTCLDMDKDVRELTKADQTGGSGTDRTNMVTDPYAVLRKKGQR